MPFPFIFPGSYPQGQGDPRPVTIQQAGIIHYALAMGVALFAVVAAAVGPLVESASSSTDPAEPGDAAAWADPLIIIAVAMTFAMPVLAHFVRGSLVRRVREDKAAALAQIEEGRVPPPLVQGAILSAAMIEAAGLLGTVVLLLLGDLWLIALPIAAVIGILLLVPTQRRLKDLVEGLG